MIARTTRIAMTVAVLLGSEHVGRAEPQRFGGGGSGTFYSVSTFGESNGRFWTRLADNERPMFLLGILNGWKLRGETEDRVASPVLTAMTFGAAISYSELVRLVDSAYTDSQNLTLPVGWVLMGSLAVQRGETTPDVLLPALRRHLADVSLRGTPVTNVEVDPIDTILFVSRKSR
jgi:hypothetical protein